MENLYSLAILAAGFMGLMIMTTIIVLSVDSGGIAPNKRERFGWMTVFALFLLIGSVQAINLDLPVIFTNSSAQTKAVIQSNGVYRGGIGGIVAMNGTTTVAVSFSTDNAAISSLPDNNYGIYMTTSGVTPTAGVSITSLSLGIRMLDGFTIINPMSHNASVSCLWGLFRTTEGGLSDNLGLENDDS